MGFEVTVIIATTAEEKRSTSLRRAINSVLLQAYTKLVVIINGEKFNQSLRQELENLNSIECHYLLEGNFPEAIKYAREIVDTDYFAFLDDDDELIEGSILNRLNVFKEGCDIDVVIGNGYRINKDKVKSELLDTCKVSRFNQNPLLALFQKRGNWLASCSGLYKTSSIPQEYFNDYAKYAEGIYGFMI